MKKITAVAVSFTVLLLTLLVSAENPTYVGAQKCKGCHTGPKNGNVYEKWQKNVHAKAFETLKAKGEEKNPKCLICHVTGFNDGGYKVGDPNASKFEGVQCEACHGKGALYKKNSVMKDVGQAVNVGLLFPVEAVCIKCHNKKNPTFKGFDFNKSVKKIDHHFKEQF